MRVPMLNYCCCGCTLRTGTILIGSLQLVRAVLALFVGAFETFRFHVLYTNGWVEWTWGINAITMLVLAVIMISAGIVLIVGANKNRHRLVFWWLIINTAVDIIVLISLPVSIILMFEHLMGIVDILYIVVVFFALAVEVYFLLVVYSYFRIIVERAPGEQEEFV